MKYTVDIEFEIGETVFLKTDPDQLPRLVQAIVINPEGGCRYILVCGLDETAHYLLEISHEKNLFL